MEDTFKSPSTVERSFLVWLYQNLLSPNPSQ